MEIPHKDISINDVDSGKELVSDLRSSWSTIKCKVFDAGITNKLFGYIGESCQDKNEMILLRIYGKNTSFIIDRKRELETHVKLNKTGFASQVYCTLNNGYLYGYKDGNTLTAESVRDPKIAPIIAKSIAQMHCKVPITSTEPVFYSTLCSWLRQLPDDLTSGKLVVLKDILKDKATLVDELDAINSKIINKSDLHIGFCHNDLLLENIIYDANKQSISFIDYEYGNTNYLSFDLGNHFCEYAGVETVDFNRYPDESYQKWWLTMYLEEIHRLKELGSVSDDEVESLYREVNFFSLCAHIWWGIWAAFQTLNSDVEFDFANYSRLKLGEYFKQKEKFFNYI
jgi:ethanolamine kinase